MSAKKDDDATLPEDATLEQVEAAEPVHPDPVPGTGHDPAEAGSTEELRGQIEETRGELGDTVEALAHKLDVKARAKEGIEERKQAAKEGVAHAKESLSEAAGRAQGSLSEAAGRAQGSLSEAAGRAQHKVSDAASGGHDAVGQAGEKARENEVPVAAIAAVAGLLVVVIVWRRSR